MLSYFLSIINNQEVTKVCSFWPTV